MNCLYLHNRKETGPKQSTWFAFHYLTEELTRRGHKVVKFSVDYGVRNINSQHWCDMNWQKADMFFTVYKNSEGPLLAAKLKGIPSFVEIGFACPEVALGFVRKELHRVGLPETEIRGDMPLLGRDFYRLPTYIVGVGNKNYTLKNYLDYKINNVKLFKLGIDHDKYVPDYKLRGHGKIKFTFTAGLVNFRKGIYYLTQAWKKLPKNYLDKIELHITGLLIEELKTKEMVDSLAQNFSNVFCHGFISNESEEYLRIHSGADAMILPTLAEGQVATVLEGLSFGLYPIVSPYTGTDMEEFPARILNKDPKFWIEEIINGIKYVVDNYHQVVKVRGVIRQKICREYNWARFAKEEVDFFEEIVTRSKILK